jgi:hypothetical protein
MPGFRKTRKTRKRTRRRFKGGLSGAGRSRKKRSGGASMLGAACDDYDYLSEMVQVKSWADQLKDKERVRLEEIDLDEPLVKPPVEPSRPPLTEEEQAGRDAFFDLMYGTDSDEEPPGPNLEDDDRYKHYLVMLDDKIKNEGKEEACAKGEVRVVMEADNRHYFEVLDMPRKEPVDNDPYEEYDGKPMTDPSDIAEVRKRRADIAKQEAKYHAKKAVEDAKKAAYDLMTPSEKRKSEIDDAVAKYYNKMIDMAQHNKGQFRNLLKSKGVCASDDFGGGKSRSSSKKKRRRRTRRQR